MTKNEYSEINRKLDKINRGLYGDDDNNQQGLLDRVQRLEALADRLDNAKWYVLGALGIIFGLWSLIRAGVEIFSQIKGG